MENTGNTAKDPGKNGAQPTEESSTSSAPPAKKSTRPALTANERLEILQQAIVDLALVGIESGATEIYQDGQCIAAIYLPGVHLDNGRLVTIAINGKETK